MDDLLSEFLAETSDSLIKVETSLVHLEQHPHDKAALNTIFRAIHTIKGTCGFFEMAPLEALSHATETVLDRFREEGGPVPQSAFPVLLIAIDRIKSIVAGLKAGETETTEDNRALIQRLELCAEGEFVEIESSSGISAPEELPSQDLDLLPPSSAPPEVPHHVQAETVRVNLSVLDDLMGMVSELVITRNQLLRMARDQGESPFAAPLKSLSQIVSGLQDSITLARVQPVQNAWAMLPRIVRDLAHDLDKKIVLEMAGGEAELDRQVIEAIKDPLMHMIRNAADHGLESPQERREAGKAETGTISLNARSEGGYVIIELADDGRGIDLDAVTEKAISAGIISETDASALSKSQQSDLIFYPGLTTSGNVTAVSGRGVGMDVVRSNIERIGGQVEIRSTNSGGSTFRLRLPLTLSIIPALIIKADDQQFALPQTNVAELVLAGDGTQYPIDQIEGAKLLRLRDETLPLISLNDCLGLNKPQDANRSLVIVLRHGTTSMAISVDHVLDTEEIVVKPLTPMLAVLRKFSGSTILGDGRVVMILDPGKIIQDAIGIQSDQLPVKSDLSPQSEQETNVSLVLFRSGQGLVKAVPLTEIDRLEHVNGDRIETSSAGWVMRHQEKLVPILSLDQNLDPAPRQPLILFRFGAHLVGLAVDEILDIEECRLNIELAGSSDLVRGLINLDRGPVEIIDLSALAWQIADHLPSSSNEVAA